ncbi:CO or xanthine dehydrogenase, Mo-binding subunit [Duganella sp. CF517]|uniref:xanthine dehydrogenase family protein molybdopterin-binding subunit n=1 Tax=Duganella sp. CF517 TaxID=1881038 RepID=UPI0008B43F0F|nr:molybdopterin cofactor-binding domain-containing protein [Duganella sp. CF517]SEO61835.1 CO or xanthine dehydrogenase, Mo-binding subunit [Duganella sp. CF517]
MSITAEVTRRTFLKILASGATVGLSVTSLPGMAMNASRPRLTEVPAWAPEPGRARWRIDGLPKVLGQKIYARDFKARDFKDWPQNEQFLYAVRCDRYDQVVTGYDLGMLPAGLRPVAVIDAQALVDKKLKLADGMNSPFLATIGKPADFFGQPVAMLIFANFDAYRRAVKILQFNPDVIKYGAPAAAATGTYTPVTSYVRDDAKNFNYVYTPNYAAGKDAVAAGISAAIDAKTWPTFTRQFYTQTIDPMFMEPESGMAWYDPATQQLNLVLGTQSPSGDLRNAADIFDGSAYPVKDIDLLSCYPGGGFGGRDSSLFSMYLALAAPFSSGPLRWAQSRFEQFQVGLKRCETDFSETLAVDANGKIQALRCDFTLNGGDQMNLTPFVAQLAALSSMSCYNIPRAIANARSMQTPQLMGGSQRGFGGPQAFMAIETLLDEASQALNIDPFELRRRNLLGKGRGATVTGAPILQDLQLEEMLQRLERHPLWQNRKLTQQARQRQGLLYGVGFALSNEAYGTSGDGMFGAVQIEPTGTITIYTPYIDMGNGAATALGLAPASYLGRNANSINMGETQLFDALNLTTTRPKPPAPVPQNYVIKASGSASACLGAFYQYHVVEQAGLALVLQTLLPAANAIWGREVPAAALSWKDNRLHAEGVKSLPWSALVKQATRMRLPMVAVVHASYVGGFATAPFTFRSGAATLPLDYVAMGLTVDTLQPIPRGEVANPPTINFRFGRTTYAPCGSLVAATIEPRTGVVAVESVVSVLSAGVQHCPQMVSGQSQGAIAMALGNVLLEHCPNDRTGPGNGTWNLHRYAIARSTDIPRQELIVLPPAPGETTARGIAEAVMCPIGPSILNALAMATGGKRYTTTPVTARAVLESLK